MRRRTRLHPRISTGASKSLQKALRILIYLGENGPELSLGQLAAALNLNKSTVHRLLQALQKFGMVERSANGERYRLGLRLHELGVKAVESRTLRAEAHPLLREMARHCREAVSLAVPAADGVLCLDRVDSPETVITIRTAVGARFPAHCTAAAKAVLAYLPPEQVDHILAATEMVGYTPFTMTSAAEVKQNLRQIRQRGYALDHQELERGLSGVAVPVIAQANIIAAVGIAGPTQRFRGQELAQKIALAKQTAARLSELLGHWASAGLAL
jgi:IclR family KDG regulon transcriptional repressor